MFSAMTTFTQVHVVYRTPPLGVARLSHFLFTLRALA